MNHITFLCCPAGHACPLTLNMPHPVWMRVVPGEEWVMTEGTKAWATLRQHLGKFGGEWAGLTATPLPCRPPRVFTFYCWHASLWWLKIFLNLKRERGTSPKYGSFLFRFVRNGESLMFTALMIAKVAEKHLKTKTIQQARQRPLKPDLPKESLK